MVSAVLLSGALAAAVAAATVRMAAPEAPGIGSVRLGEMTAAYTTRAASSGKNDGRRAGLGRGARSRAGPCG